MKLTIPSSPFLVRAAAVLALVALGLIVWSVLSPTPISVIAVMSVGQAIGTLSLLMYLIAVIRDLRRAKVFEDQEPR